MATPGGGWKRNMVSGMAGSKRQFSKRNSTEMPPACRTIRRASSPLSRATSKKTASFAPGPRAFSGPSALALSCFSPRTLQRRTAWPSARGFSASANSTCEGRYAGDGVIRGDVKPCGLSVYQEQILFRALVLPAHFPGTTEIGCSRLGADNASILRIAFEKGGLEGLGGAVSRLHARS